MNFFELCLMVEQTTAQFLKDEKYKKQADYIKPMVAGFLSDRLYNQNEQIFIRYVNWFTKELIIQGIANSELQPMLETMWSEIGDYIVHNLNVNQLQSRYNLKDFRYQQVVDLANQWHVNLDDPKKSRVGPDGRVIIDLNDIRGFAGWKWVSLDTGFCKKEGEAGGHCGNISHSEGDNILSLRDNNNRVHLTFINNKGILGEMKGRGNAKPSSRYHPAIIKLLLSNYIGSIRGGGYAPQNNFALTDLSPQEQEMIKKQKPMINDLNKFKKHRDNLSRFYFHKHRMISLHNANSEEDIRNAIEALGWKKSSKVPTPPYELDAEERYVPDRVQRHHVWKTYEPLMHEVYSRAKTMVPDDLFAWMDKAIKILVNMIVETDKQILSTLNDKTLFMTMSGVSKLDEVIYRLMQDQPEILKGAPRRSHFDSWNEYYGALERYVNMQGYDLPPWNPKNNHIISYEYIRKLAEELSSQGKVVVDEINKIIKNDMGTEREKIHNFNLINRDERMNDPDWEKEMHRREKAERRYARALMNQNRQKSDYGDE